MNDICNSTNGAGLEAIDLIIKVCKRSITNKFDTDVALALKSKTNFSDWLNEAVRPRLLLNEEMVGIAAKDSGIDIEGLTLIARFYLDTMPHLLGPQSWYTKSTQNSPPLD